jgi:hypothetical protein
MDTLTTTRLCGAGTAARWWIPAALWCFGLLAGCGGDGGVGVGGSGAPPVGFGEGTITDVTQAAAVGTTRYDLDGTGFVVEGAPIQVEESPGEFVPAQIKLGQHIETDFRVAGVSEAVRIEAQAIGRVSATVDDSFAVLGQRIRINTDPRVGPVTVFDGYQSAADVDAGDVVEVHGLAIREPDGVYALQATRVERRAVAPPFVRLAGIVTGLVAGAGTGITSFRIGEQPVQVGGAALPAGTLDEVQNGSTVVVFGALRDDAELGPVLETRHLRLTRRANFGVQAFFGGTLTLLDTAAQTFEVNGVPVSFAGAVFNGAGPVERQYVQMRGNFNVDGSFDAQVVTPIITTGEEIDGPGGGRYLVEGPITDMDGLSRTIVVQGQKIRFSLATDVRRCRNGFGKGAIVRVEGHARSDGSLVADEMECAKVARRDDRKVDNMQSGKGSGRQPGKDSGQESPGRR